MRRRIVVLAMVVILAVPQTTGAQGILWVRQFGNSGGDQVTGISVDPSGVYVAGITTGTLPGQTSAGGPDAFVHKYDPDGNVLWTRQFGTPSDELAEGISVDSSGVYVTGWTHGVLPGQTWAGTAAGRNDAFVRKYDLQGNELWTRQFGTADFDKALGIFVDASGVYVAGHTNGTLPGQTSAGGHDAFVRKYDMAGNDLWTRQFGTASGDAARAISVDASGVYVTGATSGALPGQTWAGLTDTFVRKYDMAGNDLWTSQFGTASFDNVWGISVDASGVYVTGSTSGALPGQISAGGFDAFVRKYDPEGNVLWTRQFGTGSDEGSGGISVDASGVYVTGQTPAALPGQVSSGAIDVFVRKYDVAGNERWTRQFGTDSNDHALGISVDASGLYVAGSTDGALPGQTSAGFADAFVAKLTKIAPTELLQQLIAQVVTLNVQQGISNGLDAKLDAAVEALDDINQNNNVAATNSLLAFINYVEAQRGVNISDADANALIAAAQEIIALLSGG